MEPKKFCKEGKKQNNSGVLAGGRGGEVCIMVILEKVQGEEISQKTKTRR